MFDMAIVQDMSHFLVKKPNDSYKNGKVWIDLSSNHLK